jgi:hypothetical protein
MMSRPGFGGAIDCARAEALLQEAKSLTSNAVTLELKCITTWCSLWKMTGRREHARAQLVHALSRVSVKRDAAVAAVRHAEAALRSLDSDD